GLRNLAEDEAGGERHLAQSDTLAYLRQNLPVGAAFADGGDGRVEALDAALAVRERALALRPALGRQDDVRLFGRLSQEQLLYDEKIELAPIGQQAVADRVGAENVKRSGAAVGYALQNGIAAAAVSW